MQTTKPQPFYLTLFGILFFCATLLHLIDVFVSSPWLKHSYSVLCALLLFASFFSIQWSTRLMVCGLMICGALIFIDLPLSGKEILHSLGRNINVLSLFLLVPFFALIMSVGGYLTALKEYIQRRKNLSRHPYRLSSILAAGMGFILNLGTVPIIYHMAEESFSSFQRKRMGLIIQRAFGFCAFWSPYFVNIGLLTILFDISWSELAVQGLIIALIYLAFVFLFNRRLSFPGDEWVGERESLPSDATAEIEKEHGRKLVAFCIWVALLLLLSLVLDFILPVPMLTIVSLLAILFPVVWAVAIRRGELYLRTAAGEIGRAYTRLKNELAIFISAGFFGVAISYTSVGETISQLILTLSFGSVYVMSVLLVLMTILLSLIGIHPVIVLIGIGSSFQPDLFGVSPTYMAVLLLIAWTLATQLSPFSGSVLITANLSGNSPWVLLRKNLSFIIAMLFILPLALYLLYLI